MIDCDDRQASGFRWLHLNLADHGTQQWIAGNGALTAQVREMLLAPDTHPRALVEADCVGCVLHDFERDFDVANTGQIGALRIALAPTLMLTTRLHPLRSADIARHRLEKGPVAPGPAQALDLLVSAMTGNIADIARSLNGEVQEAEDAFLNGHHPPGARDLIRLRRRLAQLHGLLSGMRNVFHRLDEDQDLPDHLRPTVEKLVQRVQSQAAEILEAQGQLRLLRDEVDMQAAQRTNQNLYILSIITALMLPATLVTGLFGMNTGGMPLASGPHGTLVAALLAMGTAGVSYWLLRWTGFTR